MTQPNPKKQIFEHLARVGKGLAHAARLDLLEAMAQGERSVDALAKVCGMPIPNASHHLLVLKDCGLAASRKEGLQVFYRLAVPEVTMAVAAVRRIAEQQLAEVDRIVRENFESRDALQPVRREELLKMARRGEAVVIAEPGISHLVIISHYWLSMLFV
jgi:DNA-binding transcriptional ArsR family regulator